MPLEYNASWSNAARNRRGENGCPKIGHNQRELDAPSNAKPQLIRNTPNCGKVNSKGTVRRHNDFSCKHSLRWRFLHPVGTGQTKNANGIGVGIFNLWFFVSFLMTSPFLVMKRKFCQRSIVNSMKAKQFQSLCQKWRLSLIESQDTFLYPFRNSKISFFTTKGLVYPVASDLPVSFGKSSNHITRQVIRRW